MEKIFWFCENCRYRFERNKGWKGPCPYCGKEGFLRKNSIQTMIDEAGKE